MTSLQIILDNEKGPFQPGSLVSGTFVCNFSHKVTVRSLKLHWKYKEETKWADSEANYLGRHIVDYADYVLFHADLGHHRHLQPGEHIYPFSFTLPVQLPSTFQSNFGSITHYLKGVVDVPLGFDHKYDRVFEIVAPIDFNTLPHNYFVPQTFTATASSFCWWSQKNDIQLQAEIPKSAFVIGENTTVKVKLTNTSDIGVDSFKVDLFELTTYTATAPELSRTVEEKLLVSVTETCDCQDPEHSHEIPITIPVDFSAIHDLSVLVKHIQIGHIPHICAKTRDSECNQSDLPSYELNPVELPPPYLDNSIKS